MTIEVKLTLDEVMEACREYLVEAERFTLDDRVMMKDFGNSGITLLAEPKVKE